jgi:hypothetical protein
MGVVEEHDVGALGFGLAPGFHEGDCLEVAGIGGERSVAAGICCGAELACSFGGLVGFEQLPAGLEVLLDVGSRRR